MDDQFSTANINAKWLDNIYENIKNIEKMERLAYEGCGSLMDYVSMNIEQKKVVVGEVQYKNLKFIVTEFKLLLADLSPVIDEKVLADFFKRLERIEEIINNRKVFLKEMYNVSGVITNTTVTPFFHETLNYLSKLKIEIIKKIGHILYIKEEDY